MPPLKDRDARNAYMREYYAKNREKHLQLVMPRQRRVMKEKRDLLDEMKARPCLDCGAQYPPFVMDFDHVRGVKLFNLSGAPRAGYGTQKILDEIAKCDLVCANCHRLRTLARQGQAA